MRNYRGFWLFVHPFRDRPTPGDRPDVGAPDLSKGLMTDPSPRRTDRDRGQGSNHSALARRPSAPSRAVPATIVATGHDAFQTHSTERLPSSWGPSSLSVGQTIVNSTDLAFGAIALNLPSGNLSQSR